PRAQAIPSLVAGDDDAIEGRSCGAADVGNLDNVGSAIVPRGLLKIDAPEQHLRYDPVGGEHWTRLERLDVPARYATASQASAPSERLRRGRAARAIKAQ